MDEGGSRNPFLRLFSKKKTDDEQMEQEIISMVDEAHEQGALRESESMMIHNVLALDEKEAKDIMTHRKNIVAIDGNTPFSKAMDFIIEETHSRFPVYEEDIDNIIGAIHIREVLMYAKDPSVQNMPIKDIPNLIFEYGQTAGIVALEDILEEIVGNILDEHDEEEHTIEQITEDTWMMQGMTPLEEVSEILGIPFYLEDYETLNGYLISLVGKIPSKNEEFSVEGNGCQFDVLSVENKMIGKVRVKKLSDQVAEDAQTCQNEEKMVE